MNRQEFVVSRVNPPIISTLSSGTIFTGLLFAA